MGPFAYRDWCQEKHQIQFLMTYQIAFQQFVPAAIVPNQTASDPTLLGLLNRY